MEACPCCGKRYVDLGYHNNPTSRESIDRITKRCQGLGHKEVSTFDPDESAYDVKYRGRENIYGCPICRYVYRTDSSD